METFQNLNELKKKISQGYSRILNAESSDILIDSSNIYMSYSATIKGTFKLTYDESICEDEDTCPECGDTLEWEYDEEIGDDVHKCFTCDYIAE